MSDFAVVNDPEVMEEIKSLPSSQVERMKRKAETDLFFLCNGILGMKDLTPYTHGPLCRFIEREKSNRRLVTVARGTLKSSICTVGQAIQLGLNNPDDLRLAIFSENAGNATGWLHEIKSHFTRNETIREWWPDHTPERTEGPGSWWKLDEACLNRKGQEYKEATYTAAGYTSASTSQHYTHIIVDDLVGEEAKESRAVMDRANRFVQAVPNLLVVQEHDRIDFVGTRKGLTDSYAFVLEYFKSEGIALYHRPAIENGKSVFPERLSLEYLAKKRESDPDTYYSELDNNPIGKGAKDFDATRVRAFTFDNAGRVVWRDTNGILRKWELDQLDIVMTCDPNGGSLTATDYPAIVVSGIDKHDQVFVLDTWARRVEPDTFIDRIYEMWQRWNPRLLGIEQAAQQTTLFYFKKRAKDTNTHINVVPLKPKNADKIVRIRKALAPIVNQGRLFLRKAEQSSLMQQLTFFPDVTNDDEVDALAYGALVWRSPLSVKDAEEDEDAENKIFAARKRASDRNAVTGYSR